MNQNPPSSLDPVAELPESSRGHISVPRWVVYFQGGLLGVVSATFFVFGLMVGNINSDSGTEATVLLECRVSGEVRFAAGDGDRADRGAVVLLLPVDAKPMERVDPRTMNPSRFEPLENRAISLVHELGGAVTRTDENGRFEVIVDGPASYDFVVVSNRRMQVKPHPLRKDQKATLGRFFKPFEGLLGEHEFEFTRIHVDAGVHRLPTTRFD